MPAIVMFRRARESRIDYWLNGQDTVNVGDFAGSFLADRLFDGPKPGSPPVLHLIGSVIADHFVERCEKRREQLGFWGCGMRSSRSLSKRNGRRCSFFGVRGPLTATCLKGIGRGNREPIGDPGFLLPLAVKAEAPEAPHMGDVFIPHFFDQRQDDELCALTGADSVLRTATPPSFEAFEAWVGRFRRSSRILTASLHGWIFGIAFGIPTAVYAANPLDAPFKWIDLFEFLGIPFNVHESFKSADAHFRHFGAREIKLDLHKMLEASPLIPKSNVAIALNRPTVFAI